jgi:hypothetical protein
MKFFAHTAEDEQGNRLPEEKWQPLSEHLRKVPLPAKESAFRLGIALTENQVIPTFLEMKLDQHRGKLKKP